MKLKTLLMMYVAALFGRGIAANNSPGGTHGTGMITQRGGEVIATRHLLVKPGGTAGQVIPCDENDEPLGPCPDEVEVIGDPVAVALLGAAPGTKKMVADGAVGNNTRVFTADNGKVQDLPVTAGTYYEVGKTTPNGGATDNEVQVIPCYPLKTVVS